MTYFFDTLRLGSPAIEERIVGVTALSSLPVTPGTLVVAEDPVWGPGEFLFVRANGSVSPNGLVVLTPVWDATNFTYTWNATECPNTANLGRPLAINKGPSSSAGNYLWVQLSGISPLDCNANIAADTALGITATGQAGAVAAGKQILNSRVVTASTQTYVKVGTGKSGDFKIHLNDVRGLFRGAFVSGTGVGAAARINSIDPVGPNGPEITVSVANSADIAGNVTQTNNNGTIFYNVVHINRPLAQGQIV